MSNNLISELKKYVAEQYHVAKAFSFKTGTPRVFEVKISDSPVTVFDEKNNEIDGFVNLVFSNLDINFSKTGMNEPILYGVYHNYESLRVKIKEIQATQKAIEYVGAKGDSVAKEELQSWLSFHLKDLNKTVNHQLFGEDANVNWYYEGRRIDIANKKVFNQTLSKICEKIYHATPQYRNELINKVTYSSNINAARKNFLTALFEKSPDTNFGYDNEQMPPEKMIYITLCKYTKMFNTEGVEFSCQEPLGNPSFQKLWDISIDFLESTKKGKRPLSEFIEILHKKPFRLKNGLIDFWLLAFLRGHKDDIAIFKNNNYIPRVGSDVAELFFREAQNYEVKKFSVEGVRLHLFNKYRELTKQSHHDNITVSGFQETAKPFIVFYNKLPKYTQQTKSVSQDCKALVKVIKNAKDLERMFFEDLPIAFGTNLERLNESEENLNDFVNRINTSIAELRQSYENLINRIESKIFNIFGFQNIIFENYRNIIQSRYADIKEHLLFPEQKSFLSRIKFPLDNFEAWINSISQVLLKKQITEFYDEEEYVFYDRLASAFKELDDLLTLNVLEYDKETQQAMTIEITGSDNVKFKKNVILNKKQQGDVENLEIKVAKILENASPNVYEAVLIRLLNKKTNDKH